MKLLLKYDLSEVPEGEDTDFYWEDIVEYLTTLLEKAQGRYSGGYWRCKISGFGWRNLDGTKHFKADNGSDFLREILPDCDCTFHIFRWRNGFCIRNWHHDSPMGNEYYYITPIQYDTFAKEAYA